MIAHVLRYGKANARTKRHIAITLGCTERAVEVAIQQARLEGAPICSDETGYWLGTAEEVAECADRLRSRYINQALTARALRRTGRRLAEKQDLVLWGDAA